MISKGMWHVKDKWKRHVRLEANKLVAKHLPPTRLVKRGSLNDYLNRYKVVFIKPVFGSYGNNIIKVTKRKDGYLLHKENAVSKIDPKQVVGRIYRHMGKSPYMLQKGIPLLKLKGHPIDFRMLLLRPDDRWLVMGVMGKVATGNRIVTNYNHGGRPIGFQKALESAGWSTEEIDSTYRRMYRIGLAAARTFAGKYKHCRRLGIDYALDTNKGIWIIEVNTNPSYDLFRYHKNRKLHGRIDAYMKQIGKNQSNRY